MVCMSCMFGKLVLSVNCGRRRIELKHFFLDMYSFCIYMLNRADDTSTVRTVESKVE